MGLQKQRSLVILPLKALISLQVSLPCGSKVRDFISQFTTWCPCNFCATDNSTSINYYFEKVLSYENIAEFCMQED
jgi:hypothetical protein